MPSPDSIRFLILVIPIFLVIFGISKPLYAAIGYMIFVYCNVPYHYPVFVHLKAELVLAVIILARIMLDPSNITKLSFQYNPVNRHLVLFTLCIFLSFGFAWDYQLSWDNAVYHFIKVFILYAMVVMTIETETDLKIFAWSFLLMFAYLAYEPAYNFITKTGGDVHMYGINYISDVGLLSGHVALANNMNQMIPLAFFLLLGFQGKFRKALAALPLIIFVIALIGSGSRGGVVGLTFFGIVLVFFSQRRLRAAMIVSAVLVCFFLISNTVSSTASRIDTEQTRGRLTGITHGIEMVKRGNIFGVGPGCFAEARGRYFRHTMESHNIYGQLIGELGIPGTIVWILLLREVFLNLARSKETLRALSMEKSFLYYLASGVQASLMVRLFISLGSHGLYYFYWYVLAVISAAIYLVVKRIHDDLPRVQAPIKAYE